MPDFRARGLIQHNFKAHCSKLRSFRARESIGLISKELRLAMRNFRARPCRERNFRARLSLGPTSKVLHSNLWGFRARRFLERSFRARPCNKQSCRQPIFQILCSGEPTPRRLQCMHRRRSDFQTRLKRGDLCSGPLARRPPPVERRILYRIAQNA